MIDIDALRRDKRPQSAWVVHALIDRLEAAEKELAELRSSMKFRTSLIGRTEAERDDAKAAAENIALKLDYLRSKLETAKNAQNDWLRANAPGGWIDNLRIENEALRAKIEQREKQEPVGKIVAFGESLHEPSWRGGRLPPLMTELYALPGAQTQPAPSIPDDVMRDAKRYRFLRAAKNIPISTEAARDPIVYDAAIDAAMLAAAPEAKS